MRTVRIESNGTTEQTFVIDVATDKRIESIIGIDFNHLSVYYDFPWTATLIFQYPETNDLQEKEEVYVVTK